MNSTVVLLTEVAAPQHRLLGKLYLSAGGWVCGVLFLTFVAYATRTQSWRSLAFYLLPAPLLIALAMRYLSESPRFLLAQGRATEAAAVFAAGARIFFLPPTLGAHRRRMPRGGPALWYLNSTQLNSTPPKRGTDPSAHSDLFLSLAACSIRGCHGEKIRARPSLAATESPPSSQRPPRSPHAPPTEAKAARCAAQPSCSTRCCFDAPSWSASAGSARPACTTLSCLHHPLSRVMSMSRTH